MISKEDFFQKYKVKDEEFQQTGLFWDNLVEIYNDYEGYKLDLEHAAVYLFNTLMKAPNVHSVRYRIKDSEHVIEKIIRKKIANQDSDINLTNYKVELKDLIGLRALHLFKRNWQQIDEHITKRFEIEGIPVVNFREGDTNNYNQEYIDRGYELKKHKYGYRSIHYIIKTQPGKMSYFAEIQVRTIFEEAWSEIDHTIRYPYDLDNVLYSQFLLILNRLAGSADDMGSFINVLKFVLESKELEREIEIKEKDKIIDNLKLRLTESNLNAPDLADVNNQLDKIKIGNHTIYPNMYENFVTASLAAKNLAGLGKIDLSTILGTQSAGAALMRSMKGQSNDKLD